MKTALLLLVCILLQNELGNFKSAPLGKTNWALFGLPNIFNIFSPGFGGSSLSGREARDCPTGDGNRTGICTTSAEQCRLAGGKTLGYCYNSHRFTVGGESVRPPNAGVGGYNQGWPVGVCCFLQATCGDLIRANGTYFRNPNAPNVFSETGSCTVRIQKMHRNICQVRLDFLTFSLAQPEQGNCLRDRLIVSGSSRSQVIPAICGINSGQHLYVDVARIQEPISISVLTMGQGNRQFDIRITQIDCWNQYRAPDNCLQYYYDIVGDVKSFNFHPQSDGQYYFNNLDYSMCFRKGPDFCSITYSVPSEQIDKPSDNQQTAQHNFKIQAAAGVNEAAGAGIQKCPSDFLLLGGIRYCGGALNSNIFSPSPPATNTDVTDNSTGPLIARFVTDSATGRSGFYIHYRLNPCLLGG